MANEMNQMPAPEELEPEAEEASEPKGQVAEALEALNNMAKRGLISHEQYQATLARLGESVEGEAPEAEPGPEGEQPQPGAGVPPGLKAALAAKLGAKEQ